VRALPQRTATWLPACLKETSAADASFALSCRAFHVCFLSLLLSTAGTGAVMCVPAHDTRDHSFALANELPITPIVMPVRF